MSLDTGNTGETASLPGLAAQDNYSVQAWMCKALFEDGASFITVIPTLLGGGIRLFGKAGHEIELRLFRTQSYNGMTDLVYVRR